MKSIKAILKKITGVFGWFIKKSILVKIIIIGIILVTGFFVTKKIAGKKSDKVQYQTAKVEKGTLTIVITASGQVSQANSATVNTEASGVVSQVYLENGQEVSAGDKIAELDLDLIGKQREAQAWSSYQSAKNNLDSAQATFYSLHSTLFTSWDTYMNLAQNSKYENSDRSPNTGNRIIPEYISTNDNWLSAEAKYKNQQNVVSQAQTSLNSAWLSYQQTSSTIYAPIPGTVTGLSLQIGSVLTAQSNTSGTSTAQKIASIQTSAAPIIEVNLSQVDTPKVKIGNKVTLTFDAFPGKTFTGKIISIDTIGAISSGVTTYPAVIKLDSVVPEIFSNMTAVANIITQIKNNVLLVPISAVQTQNEESTVRIMKNGQVQQAVVETGLSSGTQMEIVSGLSEGDTVVTSIINSAQTTTTRQNSSVFGSFGGGNGAARGAAFSR